MYYTCAGEEAAYNIISPLRAFLLRERSPDRWRLLWAHMSHDRKRAESTFWKERTHKVIKALEVQKNEMPTKTNHNNIFMLEY